MRRRDFITLVGGVSGQVGRSPYVRSSPINFRGRALRTFDPGTLQSQSPRFGAFFESLRERGYVDGQTIAIDYLSANGNGERFPALAAECLRLKADIIAVSTTPAAQAAKNATLHGPDRHDRTRRPCGDPPGRQHRPAGGNITGMSQMVTELAAKRLGLLKQAVPEISASARALVPCRPDRAVTSSSVERSSPFAGRDAAGPGHPERR